MSNPNRGKFLSTPAPTPAPAPAPPTRGKFLNATNPSDNTQKITTTKQQQQQQQQRATPYSDASIQVFQDLDQAENLCLNLLQVASQTADLLGRMAIMVDDNDACMASIETSGEEYLSTVKTIHLLLAPHAEKVLPYTAAATATHSSRDDRKNLDAVDKDTLGVVDDNSKTTMYAARVERTLAEEKKNVLQNMLKVLNEETKSWQSGLEINKDQVIVGGKRKAS